MIAQSCLDDLEIKELVAFIFLVDQDKKLEDLKGLVDDFNFLKLWHSDRLRITKLIEHYPDIDEERHFLAAMLEAAHGLSPFSEETRELRNSLKPFMEILVKIPI